MGHGYGTHYYNGRVYSLGKKDASTYDISLLDVDAATGQVYSKTLLPIGNSGATIASGAINGDNVSVVACF